MNARLAFLTAPVLVTAYGLIRLADGLDGERGPGPAWTAGHLAFLGAMVLFVPVLLVLRRLAGGGRLATATAAVGLAGAGLSMAQITIDIVVGLRAADHAAMGPMFDRVSEVPGVTLAVYDAGPSLFYVGLLAAAVHLAARRAAPVWVPFAILLASLASAVNLDLLPAAGLLMLSAFAPLIRPASAAVPREAGPRHPRHARGGRPENGVSMARRPPSAGG
ncbi:hypothetical protein GCM10023191_081210 [Actinoallomurus oryzae]|uniref:Uncharacterized protein n=1 Tax=Actinoallomurus oryzae TaxID=502180 RepID=A0ABP8QZ17_9ACTN